MTRLADTGHQKAGVNNSKPLQRLGADCQFTSLKIPLGPGELRGAGEEQDRAMKWGRLGRRKQREKMEEKAAQKVRTRLVDKSNATLKSLNSIP